MSISQSSQTPILAGGYITTSMIHETPNLSKRQCKIITKIGPACWSTAQLERLMDVGMNTAYISMSDDSDIVIDGDDTTAMGVDLKDPKLTSQQRIHAVNTVVIERIRKAATNVKRNIAVMMEILGPDVRTGRYKDGLKEITLQKNDILVISTYNFTSLLGDATKITCTYPNLVKLVQPGNQILIGDGRLILTVLSTDTTYGEIACRIENQCTLPECQNICVPSVNLLSEESVPNLLTPKDIDDIIHFGLEHRVDYLALSCVRSAKDVQDLRTLLSEQQYAHQHKLNQEGTVDADDPELRHLNEVDYSENVQNIKIFAKIDTLQGLMNFDSILKVSDGIIIKRGHLGMEIPPQKIFLAQKMMIRECNIVGKPVIVATQLLESMVHNPRPTRAECSDVANAVLDGTDALLLTNETAYSPYFDKAVQVTAKTIIVAEASQNHNYLYTTIRNTVLSRFNSMSSTESLASSAVKTAIDVDARIIVVLSQSGVTARYIAKFRSGKTIVCLTTNPLVARQTSGVLQGVHSYLVGSLAKDFVIAQETGRAAVQAQLAKYGDLMVIVCGTLHGYDKHQHNQVRVEMIQEPEVDEITGEVLPPGGGRRRQNTLSKLTSFEVAYKNE